MPSLGCKTKIPIDPREGECSGRWTAEPPTVLVVEDGHVRACGRRATSSANVDARQVEQDWRHADFSRMSQSNVVVELLAQPSE
jgi:hypothetical protein